MNWALYLILAFVIIYIVAYLTTQGGKMAKTKETILVDFDGVINLYRNPCESPTIIADSPVVGAREAIRKLRRKYKVIVISTRCLSVAGSRAVEEYLKGYKIVVDGITSRKEPAKLLIDDRAVTFDGDWDAVLKVVDVFLPWNRRGK